MTLDIARRLYLAGAHERAFALLEEQLARHGRAPFRGEGLDWLLLTLAFQEAREYGLDPQTPDLEGYVPEVRAPRGPRFDDVDGLDEPELGWPDPAEATEALRATLEMVLEDGEFASPEPAVLAAGFGGLNPAEQEAWLDQLRESTPDDDWSVALLALAEPGDLRDLEAGLATVWWPILSSPNHLVPVTDAFAMIAAARGCGQDAARLCAQLRICADQDGPTLRGELGWIVDAFPLVEADEHGFDDTLLRALDDAMHPANSVTRPDPWVLAGLAALAAAAGADDLLERMILISQNPNPSGSHLIRQILRERAVTDRQRAWAAEPMPSGLVAWLDPADAELIRLWANEVVSYQPEFGPRDACGFDRLDGNVLAGGFADLPAEWQGAVALLFGTAPPETWITVVRALAAPGVDADRLAPIERAFAAVWRPLMPQLDAEGRTGGLSIPIRWVVMATLHGVGVEAARAVRAAGDPADAPVLSERTLDALAHAARRGGPSDPDVVEALAVRAEAAGRTDVADTLRLRLAAL